MKVTRSTMIDLPAQTVWEEVQTVRLLRHIAWPIMRFAPPRDEPFATITHGGRYQVRLWLFGVVPLGTQWIVSTLHDPESDEWPKQLRDNGYSALIKRWDHWITIEPDVHGGTKYMDEVEISAGVFTPIVWTFAEVFYWHRQRRWRELSKTLRVRSYIDDEMREFHAALAIGDREKAWRALERAHILSQSYLGLHLANHWAMLRFAISMRDVKEAAGQVLRLVLAPLGSMTGRIPTGNTGRSNISAFQVMDVPSDLKALMTKKVDDL